MSLVQTAGTEIYSILLLLISALAVVALILNQITKRTRTRLEKQKEETFGRVEELGKKNRREQKR